MRLRPLFTAPFRDVLGGLEACVQVGVWGLIQVFLGLVAGWWAYVPVHEILHAAACVAAGGAVERLEIAPEYGGALLGSFLPFVVSGGEYAGRLSGFDTRGSDLVYLATDLGPFLLTLFPGVWLLRWAASRGRGFLFGLALPLALAPFLSLTGDAYEIGSILVTRLPPLAAPQMRELLRGDDLFVRAFQVYAAGKGWVGWVGLAMASSIGLVWAFGVYGLGRAIAAILGRRSPGVHD